MKKLYSKHAVFPILIIGTMIIYQYNQTSSIPRNETVVLMDFIKSNETVVSYCQECFDVRGLENYNLELNFLKGVPQGFFAENLLFTIKDKANGLKNFRKELDRLNKIHENLSLLSKSERIEEEMVEKKLPEFDNNFSPLSTRIASFQNYGIYVVEIHCRDWRMELIETFGMKFPKKGPSLILNLVFDAERSELIIEDVGYWNYE